MFTDVLEVSAASIIRIEEYAELLKLCQDTTTFFRNVGKHLPSYINVKSHRAPISIVTAMRT
jgi:hypothetical protein